MWEVVLASAFALAGPRPETEPSVWAAADGQDGPICERQGEAVFDDLMVRDERPPYANILRMLARCPSQPYMLIVAAYAAMEETARSSAGTLEFGVAESAHQQRLLDVLSWLDRAEIESSRRGWRAPPLADVLRTKVLLGLGRPTAAAETLRRARQTQAVERWRLDSMGAVVALMKGQLDDAIRLACLARADAPAADNVTNYVLVLALDRASSSEANVWLQRIHSDLDHVHHRNAAATMLPFAEILYLRALDIVHDDPSRAIQYWQAYVDHPQVAPADRELARRHIADAVPSPVPTQR